MDLAQARIGFPVIRLECRVHHSTPRPPTAFERVLLKLCDRFGANETYNNFSLTRIFEEILGVADPAPILQPTLEELVMLNVLRCQGDITTIDRLTLRDFEITDRGRQMLTDDMLPARLQENDETFVFDPVRKRLLSATEVKVLRPDAPAVALDATVFQEVLPEEAIRKEVLSGSFSWWNKASRIERIERRTAVVLWRETPARIAMEQDSVRVLLRDADQTDYVNSLPAEEVYRRILTPVLLQGEAMAAKAAQLPVGELTEASRGGGNWVSIPDALRGFPGDERVWLVDRTSGLVPLPDEAGVRQAIIYFDASLDSGGAQVSWNKSRNGCIVAVRGQHPLPGALLASLSRTVSARRVRIRVAREPYEVPLAYCAAAATARPGLANVLPQIAALVRATGRDGDTMVPAIWMSESDFWRDHIQYILARAISLRETLDALLNAKTAYLRVMGKMDARTWDAAVARAVSSRLDSDAAAIAPPELDLLMSKIEQCKVTDSAVLDVILNRVAPPQRLADFGRISTAVRKGGSSWQVPFPSRLYSMEIYAAVAAEFGQKAIVDCLCNDNIFDRAVRSLHTRYFDLNAALGSSGVAALATDDAMTAVLKSPNLGRIAELAEAWCREFRMFRDTFPEMVPHLAGSALQKVADRIDALSVLLRKLVAGLDPKFRRVFVVDTSALLARPDLLTTIRGDELVVVSKRVIEELDDHKRDGALQPRVAQATRMLNEFPKAQLQFCDGDVSLLPPVYRLKGGTCILSVAVRYRRYQPTLVTNDSDLAHKARAEGIAVMDAAQFTERPCPSFPVNGGGEPANRPQARQPYANPVESPRRQT